MINNVLDIFLEILRCPICGHNLELSGNRLKYSGCKRFYDIKGSIIDLLPEEFVFGSDREWMEFYDKIAPKYFKLFHRIIPVFTLGAEIRARKQWIKLLELERGDIVLDVSTGTGRNLSYLAKKVGREGIVYGVDISLGMLRYAAKISQKMRNVVLIRANASHLPFKNECFEAVFHVGGINTFEEKELAIKEMFRVARPGAKIVVIDEGLDPKLRNTKRGQKLLQSNALYASTPPVEEFRKFTNDVSVQWGFILNKMFPIWPYYLLEARKPSHKIL